MSPRKRFNWHRLIQSLPEKLCGIISPASAAQIDDVQNSLGVTLEATYIEFLASVGFLACYGVKINGICNTLEDEPSFQNHFEEVQREFDVVYGTLLEQKTYGDQFPPRSFILGSNWLVLPSHRIIDWPAEPGYFDVGHTHFLEFVEWCFTGPWSRLGLEFSAFMED